MIGHHACLRDVTGNCYPICACTLANHARHSSVQVIFCGSIIYLSNTWEKSYQVESVEPMEEYHKKFVEKAHHLIYVRMIFDIAPFTHIFFPSDNFFLSFFLIKEQNIYTTFCNKNMSLSSVRRKGTFISLTTLA